ncbi:MAG: hypothetical protein Q7J27_02830 [Syntrophales bacterium]|nr:hypothetical protein [Syntrophales bacterium]
MMEQKKKSDKKSWTILVIGDKERIRSFEITKAFIVTLIAIALGLVTGVTAALWFHDRAQLPTQTELVEKLEYAQNGLKTIEEENSDLKAKVQILKDELILTKQKLENTIQSKKSPEVLPSTDAKTDALRVKEKPSAPETVDKPYAVSIENFKTTIDQTDSTCNFNFTLRNKADSNITLSGHIFVILKSDISDIESWRIHPKTTFKNGRPQNFKIGERFSISRFRGIKGKIRKIPVQKSYDSVSILVFSDDGNLVLEENIDLKTLTE